MSPTAAPSPSEPPPATRAPARREAADPVSAMAVEVQVHLAADPDRVWSLLTDVERMAGLGPELVAARWVRGQGGVGAEFEGDNVRGERAWTTLCTVTEWEPRRCFAWRVGAADQPQTFWSYRLHARGAGTDVVHRMEHGPGTSGTRQIAERHPDRAAAVVAARSQELERNMRSTLAGAAALLDGRAAGHGGGSR